MDVYVGEDGREKFLEIYEFRKRKRQAIFEGLSYDWQSVEAKDLL